jgi:hypothetical protein
VQDIKKSRNFSIGWTAHAAAMTLIATGNATQPQRSRFLVICPSNNHLRQQKAGFDAFGSTIAA